MQMFVISHCTISHYTVTPMLYVYMCLQLYPFTCTQVVSLHLYSCMLFPVWCSALVLTDCQSNVLTPSICSMVTSLMDVMSYTCGCKLSMLLVMWSPVAVLSVLSVYTQYTGHHQVFCLYLCNLIHVLYTYMHTILYSNTFSCVNHYCPCVFVTHSCV